MKINKISALLLAAILLSGTLAGCGSKETSPADDPNVQLTEATATFERGSVTDGVYTNEAAELSIAIPDGWTVSDDAALGEAMSITYDESDPESFDILVSASSIIYDLVATSTLTYSSIIVQFNNLSYLGQEGYTPEQFLALYSDQIEAVEGADYTFSDTVTKTIADHEYAVMDLSAVSTDGTGMTQRCYARESD